MTRFLLDTGAAGDYNDRRHGVYERARAAVANGNRVGIALPVLAELWYGVENSKTRDRNAKELRRAIPEFVLWPLTEAAAEDFGQIAADLRRKGRLIGAIDMLIAAIARSLGNTVVVTADSDPSVVPGLAVENWRLP
jgi:tRNA(fMet)-specific endonuclease VapC